MWRLDTMAKSEADPKAGLVVVPSEDGVQR
jgi:hypothetical protein